MFPKTKREWWAQVMCSPNLACRVYVSLSYLYYIENTSCVSDTDYDYLCQYLLKCYDEITDDRKRYIDKGNLQAGTGFTIKQEDYSNYVINASFVLVEQCKFWDNDSRGGLT